MASEGGAPCEVCGCRTIDRWGQCTVCHEWQDGKPAASKTAPGAPAAGGTGWAATEAEVADLRKRYAARLFSMRENAAGPALYFGDLDGIVFEDGLHEDMGSNLVLWLNKRLAEDREAQVIAAARAHSPAEAEVLALREERDNLRGALIATSRAVGAYLREDVSTSFLALIPDETRLVMQRHARAREENERLRALLAASPAPCPYCALPADRMAECARGFPGCGRADDLGTDDLPPMPDPDPERAAADDPVPEFDGSPATPTSVGDGHGRG